MRARTDVHVVAADPAGGPGAFRVARLHCEAPLTVRHTLDGLTMMASAGGPLGGDDLALTLRVGSGAAVTVGSAAGSVVLPGPGAPAVTGGADAAGDPSARAGRGAAAAHVAWTVQVDEGACLDWRPEPTVVAAGAALHTCTTLDVAATGRVRWREILAAGREGEPGGDLLASWSVTRDGRPLLRQDVRTGPHAPDGWDGLTGTAGMRVLGTLLVVDPGLDPGRHPGLGPALEPAFGPPLETASVAESADGAPVGPGPDGWVAALPLDGPAVLVTALGMSTLAVTRLLERAAAALPTASLPAPAPPAAGVRAEPSQSPARGPSLHPRTA